MPAPIIAITATSRRESDGDPARVRLNAAYIDAVSRAGGVAMITPPVAPNAATAVLRSCHGLLLTGGEDVDPAWYGAEPAPRLGRVTPERDRWEIALVRAAQERRVPVLAVCRGIQVLNVALGGSLIQDIGSERPDALVHEQQSERSERTHPVRFHPGSRLAGIMGGEANVNSMHHQAVERVAPGFAATATSPDGMVEGIEWSIDDWWAVGVQWHPEELDGADAALFSAFVRIAGG